MTLRRYWIEPSGEYRQSDIGRWTLYEEAQASLTAVTEERDALRGSLQGCLTEMSWALDAGCVKGGGLFERIRNDARSALKAKE